MTASVWTLLLSVLDPKMHIFIIYYIMAGSISLSFTVAKLLMLRWPWRMKNNKIESSLSLSAYTIFFRFVSHSSWHFFFILFSTSNNFLLTFTREYIFFYYHIFHFFFFACWKSSPRITQQRLWCCAWVKNVMYAVQLSLINGNWKPSSKVEKCMVMAVK